MVYGTHSNNFTIHIHSGRFLRVKPDHSCTRILKQSTKKKLHSNMKGGKNQKQPDCHLEDMTYRLISNIPIAMTSYKTDCTQLFPEHL